MAAELKFLKSGMGRVLDLMPQLSCYRRLFRSFEDHSFVLLGSILGILHLLHGTMRGRISIKGDCMGRMTLMSDRFLEERLGCGHIAVVLLIIWHILVRIIWHTIVPGVSR
jgi:hypothetical protein